MSTEQIVTEVSGLIAQARRMGKTVHLVCPQGIFTDCRKAVVGCSPRDTSFEGNTFHYQDGSVLHLKGLHDLPPEKPFEVFFVMGDASLTPTELGYRRHWRDQALEVLNNMGQGR